MLSILRLLEATERSTRTDGTKNDRANNGEKLLANQNTIVPAHESDDFRGGRHGPLKLPSSRYRPYGENSVGSSHTNGFGGFSVLVAVE